MDQDRLIRICKAVALAVRAELMRISEIEGVGEPRFRDFNNHRQIEVAMPVSWHPHTWENFVVTAAVDDGA